MALTAGTRLGPYEVVAAIGAGGMGEVWRARDTKLGRDVALKILPEQFATDPDRLARFKREAQVLASLNHPNIGGIYGLEESNGVQALVLELVEGPTLADRIAQGRGPETGSLLPMAAPSLGEARQAAGVPPSRLQRSGEPGRSSHDRQASEGRGPRGIPIDEALPIAKQIAEALETAHEQGIIHRDLKPSNIKLRPDGTVKVLDFGLAKALAPAGANSASVTQSPTITSPALMTGVGVLLGTAAYMSPEQAKGREADKRSDVWAFGCVLYEMLTGKRAFDGDEISDTLAAVLRAEPDWSRLPAGTPVSVRRLLRRCLTRNLRLRLQDIADGRIEIEEALASPHAESVHPLSRQGASEWRPRIAIAAITLIIGAVAGWALRPIAGNPTSSETSVWGLSIVQPQGTVFTTDAPQISPDGRVVAFVAIDTSGRTLLYVRFLDSSDVRSLPGTDGASMPFWSPDSQALGFFAQGQLKIVGLSGGDPQSLAAALVPRGGTWNRDGVILFASPLDLQSVSTSGGPTISLRKTQKLPTGRQSPSFLPDGRHYLYITARTGIGQTVHVGSLDSAESKEVVTTTSTAVYSEAGYLFFRRGAALMAQRFDHESRETIGSPIVVASSVAINPVTNQTLMSISRGGTLIYFDALARSQLTVTDRLGRQLAVAGSPGYRQSLCLTDDESRVVFEEVDFASGNADLWALDLGRAPAVRLTFDAALDFFPVCPANRQEDVIFTSLRSGVAQLFRVPLSEPGKDELLSSDPQIRVPEHRSLDNRWLVYRTPGATNDWDVWVMPLESPDRPSAFAASAADERDARLSPDGRWIAYAVIEQGQSEVVVQSFPKPGARWQVSPGGGSQPQWRRDGKELFYLARDNKLMVIDIDTNGRTPVYSTPRALFDSDITSLDLGSYGRQYAVFKDGQRFLLNRRSDEAIPITVIVNWKPPAP